MFGRAIVAIGTFVTTMMLSFWAQTVNPRTEHCTFPVASAGEVAIATVMLVISITGLLVLICCDSRSKKPSDHPPEDCR